MSNNNTPLQQAPLEFFGHATTCACPDDDDWKCIKKEVAQKPYRDMPCPFSGTSCIKIRKAAPNPLIGNCSVRVCGTNHTNDWIVCPKRMLQDDVIFKDSLGLLLGSKEKVYVASELKIGAYGNLDFGMVSKNSSGITDGFLGIEVQTMGTSNSGSIWTARNDFLKGTLKQKYNYNVNIKDASKKILIQLLHKGSQLARWRSTMVLIIQDCFLEHLKSTYNINAHFHESDEQDFIHIHSYSLQYSSKKDKYHIKLKEKLSTDILGLSMALISNPATKYYDFKSIEKRVTQRIKEKASGKDAPIKELS